MTKNSTSIGKYAICIQCGNSYKLKTSWQKTCSRKCGYTYQNAKKISVTNTGLCLRCGNSLSHKRSDAIYCSKTCKCMDHNFKHRGRGGKRTTTARRRLIIERDNFSCYSCGVELTLQTAEIDHLIPRSRGGSSEPYNLSASCLSCNRSRGNRIGIEQLMRLNELRQ